MAALTISSVGASGDKAVTINTATASDTFAYEPGDILEWRNLTAGTTSLTFTGSGGGIIGVPGYGLINTANPKTMNAVAVNGYGIVYLDDIWQYLQGTVTVTGAAGAAIMIFRR